MTLLEKETRCRSHLETEDEDVKGESARCSRKEVFSQGSLNSSYDEAAKWKWFS